MERSPSTETFIPMTTISSGLSQEILPDVFCLPIQVVNTCFIGNPKETNKWVLIDAGMPKSAPKIFEAAEERFGENHKPQAIILTHGHFDHVGAIIDLLEEWNVPVYAHKLELDFLTGTKDYPEPDPTVDGGLLAKISPLFPNEGIDLGEHVHPLPTDGSVPEMPGWKWIHTPGHTPGHISLFRESDRTLIVGDAFVTVKQESLYRVLVQEQEISGPPRYFTTDWTAAWDSVKRLEELKPSIAITGHGFPMVGEELSVNLKKLSEQFVEIAIPSQGRYVN
ncbi:MBL fold metallo-hydrolase [Neobacillus sp. LXY-4]|uniref:MBL fold metallo-hydrolase n=1 Tax=Neobacillus sp. LXY-4 TaxID=3379826 RepID=UPI003EE256B9